MEPNNSLSSADGPLSPVRYTPTRNGNQTPKKILKLSGRCLFVVEKKPPAPMPQIPKPESAKIVLSDKTITALQKYECPLQEFHAPSENDFYTEVWELLESEEDDMTHQISRSFAKRKCHESSNRYKEVLPYDHSRVTIPGDDKFYLNANQMTVFGQEYILTQGPTRATLPSLWKALIHHQCSLIVCLTLAVENNKDKCYPYWESKDFPFILDNGWTIQSVSEGALIHEEIEEITHRLILREFTLTGPSEGETRKIRHLHYENWLDNKAPDPVLFSTLLEKMSEYHPESATPCVIHCSAGMGRAGTAMVAHAYYQQQTRDPSPTRPINIPLTIMEARLGRMGIVSTAEQIRSIYLSIKKG